MLKSQTLLIISGVTHYKWNGQIWAFGAYAREIDIWADLFFQVTIACPVKNETPCGDCLALTSRNISIIPIKSNNSSTRVLRILNLPSIICSLARIIGKYSCVHVRLPDRLGAVGAFLAPIFSNRMIAKYAGTWPDFSGEPLSYRIQKSLLKSKWFKGPVTVYGEWPYQPKHIIPFFTSILSNDQIKIAKKASITRSIHNPVRLLFVGRLDKGKNAQLLLQAVSDLSTKGIDSEAVIIGSGSEFENLVSLSSRLKINDKVKFTGAIPFGEVLNYYTWTDMLVLVSENAEGWPKAIAEAMAFGVVCFGSLRGLIPQMLAEGRGIVIASVDSQKLSKEIQNLIMNPQLYKDISSRAGVWSQNYSLEKLRDALQELLIKSWRLHPNADE